MAKLGFFYLYENAKAKLRQYFQYYKLITYQYIYIYIYIERERERERERDIERERENERQKELEKEREPVFELLWGYLSL